MKPRFNKILSTISLAISLAFLISTPAFAVNLFNDGGFDNGVNNWSAAGYPFVGTAEAFHTGPYAAKNTITTVTSQDYYGQIYQDITPYSAGDLVYMEGWVKTSFAVGSSARAGIQVDFLNSGDTVIGTLKTEMGGTNDWFKLYVAGYAPAGTVKVRAGAFIYAQQEDNSAIGGVAFADDLFIDKIAAPGGLITNPGFESQLSGWTTGVGTYPFAYDNTVKHSGVYSASDAVDTVTGGDYYGFIYQTPSVPVGSPIYASAWGKSDISQLASAAGGLIIEFRNSGGGFISKLESKIGGRTDWRQLYVSGTVPSGTTTIKVGAFLWAGQGDAQAVNGKLYIDDFVASTSYLPPPPPQTDIINADFENGVNDWTMQFRPFVADASVKHGGNYSASHIIGQTNDPTYDYSAEIYQEFPFAASQSAYVSGWVKTQLGSFTASGGIKMGFYNSSGGIIVEYPVSKTGNSDWSLIYQYAVSPLNTAKIRISGFAWALKNQGPLNAPVYIDDMSFSNTAPSGLITNPGFEDTFSGWTQDGTGTPMNIDAVVYHGGTHSARATITQPGGGMDYWSRVYQQFSFNPGETLYATLYVKTVIPITSTATAGLMIEFLDGTSTVLKAVRSTISGTTAWTYLYVADTAPTGTVQARVSPFASCPNASANLGGSAYFDDVVASRNPLSPPEFKVNVVNGNFSSGFSGWTDLYALPAQLDTDAHSSPYSAKKTFIDIPDEDYFSILYQDIYYNAQGLPFPAAQNVYLSAWMKSNIAIPANAKVGIRLEYYDAQDVAHEIGKDEISTVNPWRKLYIAATIPAGAIKVRVSGFGFAKQGDMYALGGTFNFDDFLYSYNSGDVPPPARQTALLNLGFENGLNEWKDLYGLPTEIIADPHSGIYSAKKTFGTTPNDDYFSIVYQDIYYNAQGLPFPANQNVYLTAYIKTAINVAASASAGIRLDYFDGQEVIHEIGKDQLSANNSWRQLYIAGVIPAGAKRVRVSGFAFAIEGDPYAPGGTVNFDDIVYSYTPIPAPPLQAQLLNTGFENGLNDWDNTGKPPMISTDIVHSGNYAVKFLIDDTGADAYFGDVHQEIAVTPGKRVEATLWAKSIINPLANAKAGLSIAFFDSNGGYVGAILKDEIGGNTLDWTQLSVQGIAPNGAVKLRFSCYTHAVRYDPSEGGLAYFDDASLTITSPPPGGGCFLAGMPITMADGSTKPIEKIKVGDMVSAFNETTQKMQPDKVTKLFRHPKEDTYLIVNGHLKVTPIHRVLSKGKWAQIGDLNVGDTLTNAMGKDVPIETIVTAKDSVEVYNFEVNPLHTYVAAGFVVHNRKVLNYTIYDGGEGGP